jgi:hypothetical protein
VTQSNSETLEWFAVDLDSQDTGLDEVYHHYIDPQRGAATDDELMALPTLTAVCGYVSPPKVMFPEGTMSVCPKCETIWSAR